MRRRTNLATLLAVLGLIWGSALAARAGVDDTDIRLADVKVVEVADEHISVMTKEGVEHVIAVDDGGGTKVMIDEEFVSLKDLRVGDVVTVELDTYNPLKFAMSIEISSQTQSQVARIKP